MINFCAVCGCCTRKDIVREHLEDTLRICDVSAKVYWHVVCFWLQHKLFTALLWVSYFLYPCSIKSVENAISGCCQADIRMCSHCLLWQVWNKLLSPCLYKVGDSNRLATIKLFQQDWYRLFVTSCYELVVINLLRADNIRLVWTTCCASLHQHVSLINLVTRW